MTFNLNVGEARYPLFGTDEEIALAHAIGRAFIELQQLEFTIISNLDVLANGTIDNTGSFDVFAAKTFGNLLREMRKQPVLEPLAEEMQATKDRRDFFTHKFLFHRYGGPIFTAPAEYELLVQEAADLAVRFASARKSLDDVMLRSAPVAMFAGKIDPETGALTVVESEFAKRRRS